MKSIQSVVVAMALLTTNAAFAAEIYHFGRSSGGRSYVKHVERPLAEKRQSRDDKTTSAPAQAPAGRSSPSRQPVPSAPVDPKAAEILDDPIM